MGAQLGSQALAMSMLYDMFTMATFLASHPLHLAYLLFFSPYILSLLTFFYPLLVSTSLLLIVLITTSPYLGHGHSQEPWPLRFLGRTYGITLGALCAGLRPEGGKPGLLGQLCSFVLGPSDAAAVLRIGEIMGEVCDNGGGSCVVLDEKIIIELHLESGIIEEILEEEIKDGIEEKVVVCEDLKESNVSESSEECFGDEISNNEMTFLQDNGMQEQGLSSSAIDEVNDAVEEKRLECDPASVEIKKCEPPESEFSISEHVQDLQSQASELDKDAFDHKGDKSMIMEFSLEHESFKDVKECLQLETEDSAENFDQEIAACNAQPDQDLLEQEYKYVQESAMCNARGESSPRSTSIARRVHSRSSSENLQSDGSGSGSSAARKDKEWKRTLACKLYEERMQLKLCRDRAVVECGENMDMLWEAYEVGGGGGNATDTKRGGQKVKALKKQQEVEQHEEEEEEDDDDESSVRQLCCLQALKFSTRKMNFGGGKPNLAKISKVLRKMSVLSRIGSRRNLKA